MNTTDVKQLKSLDKAARAGYDRIVILATNHSAMTRIRDVLLDEENTPKEIEIEVMDRTAVPAWEQRTANCASHSHSKITVRQLEILFDFMICFLDLIGVKITLQYRAS